MQPLTDLKEISGRVKEVAAQTDTHCGVVQLPHDPMVPRLLVGFKLSLREHLRPGRVELVLGLNWAVRT